MIYDLNLKPIKFDTNKWFNLETGRFTTEQKHEYILQGDDLCLSTDFITSTSMMKICGKEDSINYLKKLNNNMNIVLSDENLHNTLLDRLNPEDFAIFSFRDLECLGKVVSIVDGDTVDTMVQIPLKNFQSNYCKRYKNGTRCVKTCDFSCSTECLNHFMFAKMRCRLFGIDTPEINTEDGILAKKYVSKIMLGKFFTCKFYGIGKNGRHLVLFIDENGKCINNELVQKGIAKCYYGGHK